MMNCHARTPGKPEGTKPSIQIYCSPPIPSGGKNMGPPPDDELKMKFCARTVNDELGKPLPENSGTRQPLGVHLRNAADLKRFAAPLNLTAEAELAGLDQLFRSITDFGKTLPAWLEKISFATASERDAKMRAVEFYTRMLFSALVDADRLDTEESNPATGSEANVLKRKAWRFGPECLARSGDPESLLEMLDTAIQERVANAKSKNASDAVLDVRAKVLTACRDKAASERGVFTLPVPTGGGKTLASIAFALHHITHQNKNLVEGDPRRLRRIIVVIPYLNIIQQTTRELRMVFGDLVWVKDALDPLTGETTKHSTKGKDIPSGFLTPDEWRLLQPYIVNLSFLESKMTKAFLRASDSEPVFKNDDPDRGLRLLKIQEPKIYHDGLNGYGLDLECEALRAPANYAL
jgi:hypothetical protein